MTIKELLRTIAFLLLISTAAMAQETRDGALASRARAVEPFIIDSARRYGIDPRILWTLCFVESRFKTNAVSPKGARGLMQFMPETAVRYGLRNPHDPKAAIDAAAHYLRDLLERFHGRVDLAVAAYNAGEGAVESFRTGTPLVLRTGKIINARGLITGGVPPYPETRAYVRSILVPLIARQSIIRRSASSKLTGSSFHFFSDQGSSIKSVTNRPIKNQRILNSFIEVQ